MSAWVAVNRAGNLTIANLHGPHPPRAVVAAWSRCSGRPHRWHSCIGSAACPVALRDADLVQSATLICLARRHEVEVGRIKERSDAAPAERRLRRIFILRMPERRCAWSGLLVCLPRVGATYDVRQVMRTDAVRQCTGSCRGRSHLSVLVPTRATAPRQSAQDVSSVVAWCAKPLPVMALTRRLETSAFNQGTETRARLPDER